LYRKKEQQEGERVMSSVQNFTLSLDELEYVGKDLSRPESVIAMRDGTLWCSDNRGGLLRLDPDGTETRVGNFGGEANGLAMDKAGNLYIANIGDGVLYKMSPDGQHEVLCREIDGQALGSLNYVFIDSQDRLWVSSLTRANPWFPAFNEHRTDGFVFVIEQGKPPRIVADGLNMTNEVRMDADEKYLYVSETGGCRISRFPVKDDATLGARETFGPEVLGPGFFPDGITFDAEGNLWVAMVLQNGLGIITKDGDFHMVFHEIKEDAINNALTKLQQGIMTPEEMFACAGQRLAFLTSITFAGDDLKTVYMGSLAMPSLVKFRSPVAGLPMKHWR
jgi:gluconolactonase